MNVKNIIIASLFAAGCTIASAQSEPVLDEEQEVTEYTFEPHWYVQGMIGGQHTLGEVDFSELLSPNAQIALGYRFSRLWGARLALNGWQSRAGSEFNFHQGGKTTHLDYNWTWNYLNPTLVATYNLTNAYYGFCAFNPERKWNVGVFAGIGANFAFNNDEAKETRDNFEKLKKNGEIITSNDATYLRYLWEGHRNSITAQAGVDVDYKINDALSIGAELQANVLSDHYNSKMAGNKTADWYFNALVGVKYNLGKTFGTFTRKPRTRTVYVDRVVTVHDTIYIEIEKPVVNEPLRRDIFYVIRSSRITDEQMQKLDDVVAYLAKYPRATVTVTGYADKGTGNPTINQKYSESRAEVVAKQLKSMGVADNRIIVEAKGDTVQPYDENNKNRVTICIAQ